MKRKPKHRARQFEFDMTGAFNLASEQALDGERVAREKEQREADGRIAENQQLKLSQSDGVAPAVNLPSGSTRVPRVIGQCGSHFELKHEP